MVLETPVARHKDLFNVGVDRRQEVGGARRRPEVGGSKRQDVGGASRYPRVQWDADPVSERPLYDPTEMATRNW